jgi:sarcosine oxidase, subunit beta
MRSTADAVIIGGGIIGMSVAFHLARANYGSIVLVEKEQFTGSGATSKAAGGIRAQFSTKVNIEMSMLSIDAFERFKEDTGSDALFDQVGYMFLLTNDDDVATYKKQYELQRSLGLDVELLKPEDIGQYAPHIRLDDVLLATFCKRDGLGDPHEFLSGYEHAARDMGVDIELEAGVNSITVSNGKITGLSTARGDISTNLVINCAGPHSGLIAKMIGVDLPVEPIRRQCVTTGQLDFVKPFFPMVVDVASGLYHHKESKGLLLGWADKNVEPSFDVSIDPDYTDTMLEKGLYRIPQLETAEIANQWAGLYESTPDHHAVIGWEPSVGGLMYVTGFSGHGFMHAPAAGQVAAELITGKQPSVDISPLSMERFSKGSLVEETNVI